MGIGLLDSLSQDYETFKFRAGRFYHNVKLRRIGQTVHCSFSFNRSLVNEIGCFEGAAWDPENKSWRFKASPGNEFRCQYLWQDGEDPYKPYDGSLESIITPKRDLRKNQLTIANTIVSRPGAIIAAEMGLGKTLSWIEAVEYLLSQGYEPSVWYVGPRAGVQAVEREIIKWSAAFSPVMMTYEGMVKNSGNDRPPAIICFDESSKLKTPTSKRSKCAADLTTRIRQTHEKSSVTLLTGTPAPKNPLDWFQQVNIAQPGFLKEGKINKLRDRLCDIETRQSLTGGKYPHIKGWKQDEVEKLYFRLKGLVVVQFKKHCTDLPEKQYEEIIVRPTPEMARTAATIKATATRAIEALTLLRELSDGFQYSEEVIGERECPECLGAGKLQLQESLGGVDGNLNTVPEDTICPACGGSGVVEKKSRSTVEVASPKDQVFRDELDATADIGRYIVWGGFTGTIDRLVQIAQSEGWHVLRVDGRGYHGFTPDGESFDSEQLLSAMDLSHKEHNRFREKICFVGHPQAGGMALTLTGSPIELFYSNCFSGEARMQAEDRAHRYGMDENRGLVIKDLICLPTDKLVLDNLKQKKKLQSITLGELLNASSVS